IQPTIANAGDTIALEGTFLENETTMVHFPGTGEQRAIRLGEHRASVVVPEGATSGDLYIKSGPYCLGPTAFRVAPFGRGAKPGEFQETTTLTGRRTQAAAIVVNDSVYVLGGGDQTVLPTIERAKIDASTCLGLFAPVSIKLMQPRAQFVTAVIGDWLYVFGGTGDNTNALDTIERARISSDGLGAFEPVSPKLARPRLGLSSAVIGN